MTYWPSVAVPQGYSDLYHAVIVPTETVLVVQSVLKNLGKEYTYEYSF